MDLMGNMYIIVLYLYLMGMLYLSWHQIAKQDDRIADLEDDIRLLQTPGQTPHVIEGGYIVYYTPYEEKHSVSKLV